jgi:Flagellar hook-length control protein FliK
MSDGMSTGLGQGVGSKANERADDEKTTLEQAERWATLLGAQLSSTRAATGAAPSTSGWRAGAGDMTPGGANRLPAQNAAPAAAGSAGDSGDASENRMVVRVDGGNLGEIALCVDRKDGAIRVTIGAANPAAEAALVMEREGLLQALQSQGISVDSVSVVRAGDFGTLPAHPSGATQRSRDAAQAESKDDDRERRRLSRKLNVIG